MSLSNDLKKFILSKGAKQVGFADLNDMGVSNINGEDLGFKVKSGICFLINLDANIVKTLLDGPSLEYYNHYSKINDELDSIGKDVEAFLKSKNYNAYAQTFDRTCNDFIFNNGCDNTIPHKTVGTKAGLGWIGKCDAFITNEFGSALRLSTVELLGVRDLKGKISLIMRNVWKQLKNNVGKFLEERIPYVADALLHVHILRNI